MLLKLFQPCRRQRLRLVDTVNLDTMATLRNMQTPIPRAPHLQGLRIERIIPTARENLYPALGGHGQLHVPGTPGEFVLLGHILHGHGIPREASIRRALYTFRPATTAGVCPAFDFHLAVVDNYLLCPGGHDGGGDGHFLNVDAVDGELVVFADLLVVVEVFFGLNGGTRRGVEDADAVEPFDTAGADVAHHKSSDWVAVDLG